jgi:metal-responsive CopG/Arc/MetJ family transcriptional regulator
MGYVNYSIHLPDPKLLRRIKAAAKKQNVSVSTFIRSAAERAVAEHEKKLEKKQVAA